jgi:hypothetical protein
VLNAQQATEDLIAVGFTARQAAEIVRLVEEAQTDVLAEFDRRDARRREEAAECAADASGSIDRQIERFISELNVLELKNEQRHRMLILRLEALEREIGLQLSALEQEIARRLSSLEQKLELHFSSLRHEIAAKAATVETAIVRWSLTTLIAVGLAAVTAFSLT